MTHKYIIKLDHNAPTWSSFLNLGIQQAYPKIDIVMNVYEEETIVYSSTFHIEGYYYCSGSQNFEYDKIEFKIIKDCDETTKNLIADEVEKEQENIKNIFNDTVLNITDIYM